MATATELEKKHMLLSAYFPGIKTRALSQSRYLEKKLEARRTAMQKSRHLSSSVLLRATDQREITAVSAARKHGRHLSDTFVVSTSIIQRRQSRPKRRTIDMKMVIDMAVEQALWLQCRKSTSNLWTHKIARVDHSLKAFDSVLQHHLSSKSFYLS